jgi:hypothetical protein
MTRRAIAGVALLLAFVACASSTTSIGPLTMKVPEGWQVSDREGTNLKLTDGTIGQVTATKPGTATAVFDIYVESPQTTEKFLDYLREQKIDPRIQQRRIGGDNATVFAYSGRSVGGRQEAVLIPRRRVFILYRAAFRDDDGAFLRGRGAFRRALASITFSGGSSSAMGSERQGPTLGKRASTAIAAPAAIITKPI